MHRIAVHFLQRVKEFHFLSLTRWETLKKECRFRRSVLVGVHRYGRERIDGKQKNPNKTALPCGFFLI